MSIHPPLSVYVINLDNRPDRWERIKKQCLSCGITPIRVSAVKASPGWHGCAMSHKKVCELAESKGEPWYVVIEDDAVFTLENWVRFVQLLPKLWELQEQWQVFNGGPGQINNFELISRDPLVFRNQGTLTHFLCVNSSGYKHIKTWTTDCHAIDEHLKINSSMISTYPVIALQDDIQSDIGIGNPMESLNYTHIEFKKILEAQSIIEQFLSINLPTQRGRRG